MFDNILCQLVFQLLKMLKIHFQVYTVLLQIPLDQVKYCIAFSL